MARVAQEQGVTPDSFRGFINDFTSQEHPAYDEASGSGNVKARSVQMRLRMMFLAFCGYFGLEAGRWASHLRTRFRWMRERRPQSREKPREAVKTPFLPLQKAVTGLAQRWMMEPLVRMWGSVWLQEGKKDVQGAGTPGSTGK